jgi:hypothetical protein
MDESTSGFGDKSFPADEHFAETLSSFNLPSAFSSDW